MIVASHFVPPVVHFKQPVVCIRDRTVTVAPTQIRGQRPSCSELSFPSSTSEDVKHNGYCIRSWHQVLGYEVRLLAETFKLRQHQSMRPAEFALDGGAGVWSA